MYISIIAVGRIGSSSETDLVNKYINRFNKLSKLLGFKPLQIIEIDDKKYKTKILQAKKIQEIIKLNSNVVLFDQKGKLMTSENFSLFLSKQRNIGIKNQTFVIGGAFGLCSSLYREANDIFSLGKMVWPHFLARVMLTEQIYRSASIMMGNPYHKK
tara:strand:+ start:524 stop:994 length:471 start_codon:yes stop_codon:yes gene_type:complete